MKQLLPAILFVFTFSLLAFSQSIPWPGPGVAAGKIYATWNPSDKNANITLSNGNLTYTTTALSYEDVRATTGKSSGAWYWEVTAGDVTGAVGIADSTENLSNYLGQTTHSWGWFNSGGWWNNNTLQATYSTFTTNDVINFAFDATNGRLWIGKNGTWQNGGTTPSTSSATGAVAAGLTGVWFPAGGDAGATATSATANFGASAFANSVPAGFNSGVY